MIKCQTTWGDLFNLTVYSLSSRKVRTAAYRQELMQMPWRRAAYWFTPHDILSLLSYAPQDSRDGVTHNRLDPPTSIMNVENALQACPWGSLVEAFS